MDPTWRRARILLNLVLAGALLRAIGIGVHALWLDEGACWSWATRPTWGGTIFAEANHPPLWWIVTRLWIGAFGDSASALRAPAAILGIASIPLAWWLARRLLDPACRPSRGGFDHTPDGGRGARRALVFAGFVALSTYFTEYSQEARMYAALVAEGLGLSLLYLRWLDRGDRLSQVGYALLAAVALYTHYFAVWIVAGHAAHALWLWVAGRRRGTPLDPRPFLLACVGAGLLFVPWFVYLLRHYEGISTGTPPNPFGRLAYVIWRMGAGPALVVVDRTRQVQGVARVLTQEAPLVVVTAVLWFVPLVLGFLRLRRLPGTASFVVANLAVPVLLLLLVFPVFPLIHERYLVFLAPWFVLVAVDGACGAGRFLRVLLVGGLAVLLALGLVAYHTVSGRLVPVGPPQALGDQVVPSRFEPDPDDFPRFLHHGHPFAKEPWRAAHAFVKAHARAGDLVVLYPWYLHLVWDYYDRGALDEARLPRGAVDAEEVERLLGARFARCTRVFLVLAHEETQDPDEEYRAVLAAVARVWVRTGHRFDAPVRPILFDASWGVRVAIFNRR
jgi:4-amino-4-deoxy-L-arabinose transferase-like glycosyltransferase